MGILEQGLLFQRMTVLSFPPLFSRACRLKKKAQHEANKIKLWGLNQEYGQYCILHAYSTSNCYFHRFLIFFFNSN